MRDYADLRTLYQQHLIDCISQQCAKTKKHIDQYKIFFASNRHSAGFTEAWRQIIFALTIAKADQVYVYDLDGNAYLDITQGFGVHLFGHNPPFIHMAIEQQLGKGISLGPVYSNVAEAAALLCNLTKNDRCAFFNSGTEAVMVALRLARAATERTKIVMFEGAYHGTHDSVLVMKQHPSTQQAIASIPGVTSALVNDTILLKFGDEESLRFIKMNAAKIAGVITEPVRSRCLEDVNPAFLHHLQRTCREHDIAFILDEVITGFRLENEGAKGLFALDPDIVVYGKVLGGGLPIGVVAGKKKYLDFIDGGEWKFSNNAVPATNTTFVAGTFCHHPLAIATTLATLKYLQDHSGSLQKNLNERTSRFCEEINSFSLNNEIDVRLACFGSIFRFLVKGKSRLLFHALLKERVYVWEGRTCFLSTQHGEPELSVLKTRIIKCLIEMKAAEYFRQIHKPKLQANNVHYLQAGIIVDEILNVEWLRFAFRYTCEQVNQNTLFDLDGHVQLGGDGLEDCLNESAEKIIQLSINFENGRTKLFLYGSAECFDGWSLTLIFRYLGICYKSLEAGQPLPPNTFVERETVEKIFPLVRVKESPETFNAISVETFVSQPNLLATNKGRLFQLLLASFAITLGEGYHVIGVPVSGQLALRQINAVGPFTCHVPVRFTITGSTNVSELLGDIAAQIDWGRKNFIEHYESKANYSLVFNLDNLLHGFSFANRAVQFVNSSSKSTRHHLVFNVLAEPKGLHISIKAKDGYNIKELEEMLQKFSSLLITSSEKQHAGTYS